MQFATNTKTVFSDLDEGDVWRMDDHLAEHPHYFSCSCWSGIQKDIEKYSQVMVAKTACKTIYEKYVLGRYIPITKMLP